MHDHERYDGQGDAPAIITIATPGSRAFREELLKVEHLPRPETRVCPRCGALVRVDADGHGTVEGGRYTACVAVVAARPPEAEDSEARHADAMREGTP